MRATVSATAWALIEADVALAKRIAALEKVAASFAPGNDYSHTQAALAAAGLIEAVSQRVTELERPGRWARIKAWVLDVLQY